MITIYRRTNAWWDAHPRFSAATFFVQAAILAAGAVWMSAEHNLILATVAYFTALGASIDGAFEVHRASVSAGQGGV